MASQLQQSQQQKSAQTIKLCDLRPASSNSVNTIFILLEKGTPTRANDSLPFICTALVADSTGSVHFQLWGAEVDALQPGDILRLTNGIFSSYKNSLVLRAGKKGIIEKIGEFTMVFSEAPNMSMLQWVPDPANPRNFLWSDIENLIRFPVKALAVYEDLILEA